MTMSTNQRPAIARPRLGAPCAQQQIYLGNVHELGVRVVHRAIRLAILSAGRVAVFIGANGEAAAYSWRHVDFDRHCRRHAASLMGVYEPSPEGAIFDEADKALLADIRHHVAATSKGAKAA